MKRKSEYFIISYILIITVLISGCTNSNNMQLDQEERSSDELTYFNISQYYNNSKIVDKILTTSYDIEVLEEYFEHPSISEASFTFSSDLRYNKKYDFWKINELFPIECIRNYRKDCPFYTPYNVNQGGRFFVFWDFRDDLVFASQCIYIKKTYKVGDFRSVAIGKSTFKDILQIDKQADITFLLSKGIYSYSLLENREIMSIEYKFTDEFITKAKSDSDIRPTEEDLVVISKEVINKAPSCISYIRDEDLK